MDIKNQNMKLFKFIVTILTGTFSSILIGFLFYGMKIFKPGMTTFRFVAGGLLGSSIFIIKYYKLRNTAFITIFIIIAHELIMQISRIDYIIRDIFFIGGILLTVYLFIEQVIVNIKEIKFGKFLIFA